MSFYVVGRTLTRDVSVRELEVWCVPMCNDGNIFFFFPICRISILLYYYVGKNKKKFSAERCFENCENELLCIENYVKYKYNINYIKII